MNLKINVVERNQNNPSFRLRLHCHLQSFLHKINRQFIFKSFYSVLFLEKMPKTEAKNVKKEDSEEEVDDDDLCIASLAKRKNKSPKNSNAASKSPAKGRKEGKNVKKEEEDEDFEKPSSKKAPIKADTKVKEMKKKAKKEEEGEEEEEKPQKITKKRGKAGENKTVQKRERKVFDLPGQKRDTPEARDPLRIFYESLYKQVPDSEMAAIWMMESGLLPKDVAKKVLDRKVKKAKEQRLSSPMKTVVTVKKKSDSTTVVKKSANSPVSTTQKKKTPPSKAKSQPSKKRKSKDDESSDEDTDDDFVDTKSSKKRRMS
ncbi:hypothetical protein STAS_21675 [Striga asiatica]|uniref:Uncharacterized protein n=1 Tax=Striga asiatica TaxID=4170 RepID=A0A5A7QI48_STRAF|nr:hypothetical protein STAS_21675 [Striga asiatica]